MKKGILVCALSWVFWSTAEAQLTIQAGIFNPSGSTLTVRAKPSQTVDPQIFGGVNVTVRWLTSLGITLSSPTGSYSIAKQDSSTAGGYTYMDFGGTPNVTISWSSGSENDLFSVNVFGGSGTGTFELSNAGWGGGWYIDLGIAGDVTNTTTPYYQASVADVPLPVELTSFTVLQSETKAVLTWRTETEKNNYGFQVQRRRKDQVTYTDIENGFIPGHGTTNVPHSYSFTDQDVAGGPWSYRLKQTDLDGAVTFYLPTSSNGPTTEVTVVSVPTEFSLSQNYPNPFNPATRIRYALPADTHVRLEVFNVIGQKMATLVDGPQPAGYYDRTFDATGLPSGIYFYRLVTPEVSFLKKMMVVK